MPNLLAVWQQANLSEVATAGSVIFVYWHHHSFLPILGERLLILDPKALSYSASTSACPAPCISSAVMSSTRGNLSFFNPFIATSTSAVNRQGSLLWQNFQLVVQPTPSRCDCITAWSALAICSWRTFDSLVPCRLYRACISVVLLTASWNWKINLTKV